MPPRKRKSVLKEVNTKEPATVMDLSWGKLYWENVRLIFLEAQENVASHERLLRDLRKVFNKSVANDFFRAFEECVNYLLLVWDNEPAVENSLQFVVKFVIFVCDASKDGYEACEDGLLGYLLEYLCSVHCAGEKAVRYRSVQLIGMLLNSMGDGADVSEELYVKMQETLVKRAWDIVFQVRVEALRALNRLQVIENKNCEVVTLFLHQMKHDPHPEVRKTAVENIAMTTRNLHAVVERSRDVDAKVRIATYKVLDLKLSHRPLTIAKRVQLLNNGLNDAEEKVVQSCQKLLRKWLKGELIEGHYIKLLKALDVATAMQKCQVIMDDLLKEKEHLEKAVEQLIEMMNEDKVLKGDAISSESVFLWSCVLKHVHNNADFSEFEEALFVTSSKFCNFLHSVCLKLSETTDVARYDWEFILKQSISICYYLDLSDEFSRRAVIHLIKDCLMSMDIPHTLMEDFLVLFKHLLQDDNVLISSVVEVISDLRVASEAEAKEEPETNLQETEGADLVPEDVTVLQRCLELSFRLFFLSDIPRLLPSQRSLVDSLIMPAIKRHEYKIREIAVGTLGIACDRDKRMALFHIPLLMHISQLDTHSVKVAALKAIFDSFLVHGIDCFSQQQPTNSADESMKSDKDPFLSLIGDVDDLFDTDIESHASVVTEKTTAEKMQMQDGSTFLLSHIITELDSDNSELRTICAEGLTKILLVNHLKSSKLLSKLLLLWFDPSTEEDAKLRHCLACFFPLYAFSNVTYQVSVAESAIFVLKSLFRASPPSRLTEVDPQNVADFLVKLTDPANLTPKMRFDLDTTVTVTNQDAYEILGTSIATELARHPNSPHQRIYTRILTAICSVLVNKTLLSDIYNILKPVFDIVAVKETQQTRALFKLRVTLAELIGTQPTPAIKKTQRYLTKDSDSDEDEEDNTLLEENSQNGHYLSQRFHNFSALRVVSNSTMLDIVPETENSPKPALRRSSRSSVSSPQSVIT